ncbi:type VI secretion system-associated protein TagF [Tropicimonas sp. TH_r6]|uniref:type VI secretion system-associated protein TagF n=1 Tax=Tropicimonas sp. TH_r6 TaxID=3082085 RepID=UPI0029537006|nr:type VI secretion system-associated protein TagF [Tropicimonas sp. TH_r6]MDV7143099.1 type VI secretion system-associated protein TagF [Tropicimonas sp. TH_r6]
MPDLVLMAGAALLGPFGAFGKMPSLGDFFRLDVPPGFTSTWDGWLSGVLPVARTQLGPRWQDCYYNAPIWRFSLAPGLVGRHAVVGVMMPSVDRVGRAFPLSLVAPVSQAGPEMHMAMAKGFEALETVALAALEFSMTQADLRDRLEVLSGEFEAMSAPTPEIPEAFSAAGAAGFWSALDGERVDYMATRDLPDAGTFCAMLDRADPRWRAEVEA